MGDTQNQLISTHLGLKVKEPLNMGDMSPGTFVHFFFGREKLVDSQSQPIKNTKGTYMRLIRSEG